MSNELLTPPKSQRESEEPGQKDGAEAIGTTTSLLRDLDRLLERYLHLLDRHQTLQAELGKQFSSGFLALAHANYCSPPGRRYGQDYFDERMKATRRLVVEDCSKATENVLPNDSLRTEGLDVRNYVRLEKVTWTSTSESEISEQIFSASIDVNQSASNFGNEDDYPENPELSTLNLDDNNGASSHAATSSSDYRPITNTTSFKQSDDPISWFGVLVPQSLRNVQNSFTSVAETIVPQLVNIMMDMREAELKIYDLRNKIGE